MEAETDQMSNREFPSRLYRQLDELDRLLWRVHSKETTLFLARDIVRRMKEELKSEEVRTW